MAKKKKRKVSNRNFKNVKVTLNIPFDLNKGSGNSFFANRLFEKSPELKEYLTKESFEKLYDTEFSEFKKDKVLPESEDKFGDALSLIKDGNLTSEQIQSVLGTLLGQTSYGEITNFEFPDNSVGDSYVYAFNDGTPLFNPEFINNLQGQLDTLGIDLDDLKDRLQEQIDSNELLVSGSESLGVQNTNLVDANAALSGEVAALKAALALQPTFGVGGVENTGLPTTELTGNLNSDGLPTQIILNCAMNNVTSKKITVYKITPEGNEGVGLNSGVVQNDLNSAPILNREVDPTDGSIRFGNASNIDIPMTFEAESVYIFEVTGENNAGVEDNTTPKTLTKSAIFTTIDTDDSQITQLSSNLGTITLERDGLLDDVNNLTEQLNELQGAIETNTTNINTLQLNLNSSRSTLDGFSDNMESKIKSLKDALVEDEVSTNTLNEVTALIETYNNFVPNINANTPTPVAQISGFNELGVFDTDLTPQIFPEWLGGDSISNVGSEFNDNILFDVDGNIGDTLQTPYFNVPSLEYGPVESIPLSNENLPESSVQNKILVVVRLCGIKYLQGGITYPYLVRRANNAESDLKNKSRSNTSMFDFPTGVLHNYTEHSDYPTWYQQTNIKPSKEPNLSIIQYGQPNGNGSQIESKNLGKLSTIPGMGTGIIWTRQEPRGIGNTNLAGISGYSDYGIQQVFPLNGGDSFKLKMNSSVLPFKQDGNVFLPFGTETVDGAHTFSVGLQFDFIIKDSSNNFTFASRQTTGNFTFNKGA